eukprot:CAMPEP_0175871156 /NCGR_PEP_ID=MMETSP0107_2-20121207/36973_1 /TAXON_ID=195067 ORGANISM="Goniomonas pacifica, Strain CCMP1869" /NCGR_SAMPLE_ID=MMETSP0107_2 /ASSEMBLY_ACC=CAM_ASM_000203 /LENGTH=51 /DNA_ID=CAMNT_0017189493 /DNA_START=174 /DNA_END=326 /DNA_ORIENTATION=-
MAASSNSRVNRSIWTLSAATSFCWIATMSRAPRSAATRVGGSSLSLSLSAR